MPVLRWSKPSVDATVCIPQNSLVPPVGIAIRSVLYLLVANPCMADHSSHSTSAVQTKPDLNIFTRCQNKRVSGKTWRHTTQVGPFPRSASRERVQFDPKFGSGGFSRSVTPKYLFLSNLQEEIGWCGRWRVMDCDSVIGKIPGGSNQEIKTSPILNKSTHVCQFLIASDNQIWHIYRYIMRKPPIFPRHYNHIVNHYSIHTTYSNSQRPSPTLPPAPRNQLYPVSHRQHRLASS